MAPKPVSNKNVNKRGKGTLDIIVITLWIQSHFELKGKVDTKFINLNLVNDYKSSKLLSPFFLKFHFQELL